MREERNYSLLAHNTFGIDACCNKFLEYASVEEAQQVASILTSEKNFMVIGSGSNLLLTSDYNGTVVHSAIKGISLTERDGVALLRCGSGETWDDVVAWTARLGFADLINLSLIPGEAGAAAVQNIGAYGAEVGNNVHQVLAIDVKTGQQVTINGSDCQYAYRSSRFKHEWKGRYLVTHVILKLRRDTPLLTTYGNISSEMKRNGIAHPTPQQMRQLIIGIRQSKLPDPAKIGNAGSFFMNPVVSRKKFIELQNRYPLIPHYPTSGQQEKIPAAWLIEQCGWKGRVLGQAAVYEHQALVLVNRGGATGTDILALCQAIQHNVSLQFDIALIPEVNIV